MALKAVVENLDDVDEGLREQYKETVDPKTKAKVYALDIEGGVEAHPGARKLKDELAQRRISEGTVKQQLATFQALGSLEDIQAKLDKFPELEAAAEGKLDDAKINGIVETRLRTKLAPVERERDQLKQQLGEKDKVIEGFTTKERTRMIGTALTKAARDAKVVDSAMDDIELYGDRIFEVQEDGSVVTRDNVGVTPGLSPKAWLEDMQSKRPHWWGPTTGGGAGGNRNGPNGSGPNPWAHDTWNMTEQGAILKADRKRAEQLAKQAGTTLGGGRPAAPRK